MSFLTGLVFDEMDAPTDVQYFNATQAACTLISEAPPGLTGKSMSITGDLQMSIPDQAGKTFYANFWFYTTSLSGYILSTYDSSVGLQHFVVDLDTDGKVNVKNGQTNAVWATSTDTLVINQYYYLQIEAKVADSGGFVNVYVNGNATPFVAFSGDTKPTTYSQVTELRFGPANKRLYAPYVNNNDGADNNGLILGGLKYTTLTPNADGASIWTPSTGANAYPLLDEPLGAPNDTDYVSTTTLNQKNIVGLTDPGAALGDIRAVQVYSRAALTGVGVAKIQAGTKVGADESLGAEVDLTEAYKNILNVVEYKTGTTKFTDADLTNLEVVTELTYVV